MSDWYDTLEKKADDVVGRIASRFGTRKPVDPQPAAPAESAVSPLDTAANGILALPRAAMKARKTLLDALDTKPKK